MYEYSLLIFLLRYLLLSPAQPYDYKKNLILGKHWKQLVINCRYMCMCFFCSMSYSGLSDRSSTNRESCSATKVLKHNGRFWTRPNQHSLYLFQVWHVTGLKKDAQERSRAIYDYIISFTKAFQVQCHFFPISCPKDSKSRDFIEWNDFSWKLIRLLLVCFVGIHVNAPPSQTEIFSIF